MQIDIKQVAYSCLRGKNRENGKYLYEWTAIDECTGVRFVYAFEEHTPENSVKFLQMLQMVCPFKNQTIQTDHGTEFTYKYISDIKECRIDKALQAAGIEHLLIPPRTLWHNGTIERSHRHDQRSFYDWDTCSSVEDLNHKLKQHLMLEQLKNHADDWGQESRGVPARKAIECMHKNAHDSFYHFN